ncbi:casein kinase II subunit alpha [Nematocida major]|uniref:casein kinase II subunit alpha n=1 Tax=Nematocida major TaxID=1912982 RepID=UPI0020077591|nr:casein kinase II subunit alpha [Nematocida major]KAH9387186.1 casein kinase II subunit alpha [Nematocida major]
MPESSARVYATSALKRGKAYYDYNDYIISYGEIDNYEISEFLGRGKYSQVFKGLAKPTRTSCVIKVLRPIREKKINREVKILKSLLGVKNVIQLLDVVKDSEANYRALIFPYNDHTETRSLFKLFSYEDIVFYMRKLLETLDEIHSLGIFHRDLKPHNIIINHGRREMSVIDWGLAEYYLPSVEYATRVASLHFKAPELLLGNRYYDYSLDIWSAGCILGEMLFTQMPFFNGSTNEDQLERIVHFSGAQNLKNYLKKYSLTYSKKHLDKIYAGFPQEETWHSLHTMDGRLPVGSPERRRLIDLLQRMLTFDHQKRPSAQECLSHRVFAEKPE